MTELAQFLLGVTSLPSSSLLVCLSLAGDESLTGDAEDDVDAEESVLGRRIFVTSMQDSWMSTR